MASRRWPGVYWTLNDSGNPPELFAFDEQGNQRGTFRVDGAKNDDWEALQLGPGRNGGFDLFVGDVGDNDFERRDVTIYRLPEPDPGPPNSRPPDIRTAPAEAFRFTYPNGPRNVEAMLVHPVTAEIVLITKEESGRSEVYRVPSLTDSRRPTPLQLVGRLDVSRLGSRGGLVTDASVSPDGRHVVVRTYTSALEYDLADGAGLVSLWGQPAAAPRLFRIDDGGNGEGVSYRLDGQSVMSIGERSPPSLYQTERRC